MLKKVFIGLPLLGLKVSLLSHVVEVHLPNAGEDYQIEQGKKELRNQENLETYNSSSSTQDQRDQALQNLIKDGGMS